MSLLCVLSAAPRTPAQVRPLARRLLAMRPCADALLLLCDLPDAFSDVMPEDAPLLRALLVWLCLRAGRNITRDYALGGVKA